MDSDKKTNRLNEFFAVTPYLWANIVIWILIAVAFGLMAIVAAAIILLPDVNDPNILREKGWDHGYVKCSPGSVSYIVVEVGHQGDHEFIKLLDRADECRDKK